MSDHGDGSTGKGCALLAAALLAVPLVVVGIVAVRTWTPLQQARASMDKLEQTLGTEARYTPAPLGEIPAERMALFLELRASLAPACGDYGDVQEGFEAVAALDSTKTPDAEGTAQVARQLGGAAFAITPFLARFFARRNDALLAASMGLEEYSYIYALAYHDHLLSQKTRGEIFSDGDALSPEASEMLRGCLARQLEAARSESTWTPWRTSLEQELARMEGDPSRLPWQDGLPGTIAAGLTPYREQLDRTFCGATAGLEMEQSARRALRVALY